MSTRRFCRPCRRSWWRLSWRGAWHRWFVQLGAWPTHPDSAAGHPAATTSGHPTGPTLGDHRETSTADEIRARILAEYHAHTTHLARRRIVALVRSGHHIGPAPYGYRAVRLHPRRHGCGAVGTRLQPDPRTAPAVPAIYSWRLDEHVSVSAIVHRLTADPDHCPPPTDPATGRPCEWTARRVHTILTNPVYTGRTVWGRTRHRRPVPRHDWVTSGPGAHRALIDDQTFAHSILADQRADGRARRAGRMWCESRVSESWAA